MSVLAKIWTTIPPNFPAAACRRSQHTGTEFRSQGSERVDRVGIGTPAARSDRDGGIENEMVQGDNQGSDALGDVDRRCDLEETCSKTRNRS